MAIRLPSKLRHWSVDPKIDGLIFFAQTIDEMLFYFTIDTYRAPVSNVHYLLQELRITLLNSKELKLGKDGINKNIKPIREELAQKISTDPIAKKILEESYGKNGYKSVMHNLEHWTNYDKYINFIASLNNLFYSKYYVEIKNELIKAIKTNSFSDIDVISHIFVPELILKGFTSEYVYYTTDSYFFNDADFSDVSKIDEYLQNYLNIFDIGQTKWDIVFRVSKECHYLQGYLEEINTKLKELKIAFYPKVEPRTEDQFEKLYLIGDYRGLSKDCPYFLLFSGISALDPYKAKDIACFILNYLNNFLAFNTYYIQLSWEDITLAYSSKNEPILTRKSVSPLAKNKKFQAYYEMTITGEYHDLSTICKKQQEMMEIHLQESSYQLFKSLSIHTSSIGSSNIENQFLNSWICLENLLPNYLGKTILDRFKNGYLPFLNRKYCKKLIDNFQNDLGYHTYGKLDRFFSDFPPQFKDLTMFEKCAVLLAVNDPKENLILHATTKIGRNPLLIYRMNELHGKLSSAKSIRLTIQNHNQKVDWHLTRLYRARNMLTHLGEKNFLLSKLLENLDFYYHVVIDQMDEISTMNPHLRSLEAIFDWISIDYSSYLDILQEKKTEQTTYDNYKNLLFGT